MKDLKRRSAVNINNISSDSDDELVTTLVRRKRSAKDAKLAVISNNVKQVIPRYLNSPQTWPFRWVCDSSSTIPSSAAYQSTPMVPRGVARILDKGVLDYAREACAQNFKPLPLKNR